MKVGSDNIKTGEGDPNTTNPTTGEKGDIYIDESTGDTYYYDETTDTWKINSDVLVAADGTVTHTAVDGTEVKFDITQSGAVDPNTNGTAGEAGDVYVDESTGDIYTHNGTDWVKVGSDNIKTGEGDPITKNPTTGEKGDIYIDESTGDTYYYDETTDTWKINSDVLVAADGTVTHTAVDGTEVTFDYTQSGAGDPITNGTSGTAGDVYVDETTGDVYTYNSTTNTWEMANPETLTSASFDSTTGILTYNDEAGTANAIDLSTMISNFETLTSISQDVTAGTITYVDEAGKSTVLDIAAIIAQHETLTSASFDSTTGILTYNDEAGTANAIDLSTMISNFETLTSISQDVTAGTITYVDEDGLDTVLTIADIIAQHETVTTLSIKAGALEYANEDATNANVSLISTDADNAITAGTDGALFADVSTLEPWQVQGSTDKATANTDAIYQNGAVGIGIDENTTFNSAEDLKLGVNGSVRGAYAPMVAGGLTPSLKIGFGSTAFGFNAKAEGMHSMAFGKGSAAIGNVSMALGDGAVANNLYSLSIGNNTQANADESVALGYYTEATAKREVVIGAYNAIRNGSPSNLNF